VIYIGIDPGLDGGIAVIRIGANGVFTEIYDTPVYEVKSAKKTRREMNLVGIVNLFVGVIGLSVPASPNLVFVVLEKVHSMPEQGVSSSFNFGRGFGQWEGILAAMEIPYMLVDPRRWKAEMMPDMGKDKDAARMIAGRLFPQAVSKLSRKKDDGRAEALLLAEYGRRERDFGGKMRLAGEKPQMELAR
jgi:hypothetical protein